MASGRSYLPRSDGNVAQRARAVLHAATRAVLLPTGAGCRTALGTGGISGNSLPALGVRFIRAGRPLAVLVGQGLAVISGLRLETADTEGLAHYR